MKKVLFASVLALFVFASCSKKADTPSYQNLDFSKDQVIKGGITTEMVQNMQKNALIASGTTAEVYTGKTSQKLLANVGYKDASGKTYTETGILAQGTSVVVTSGKISIATGGNPVYWIIDDLIAPCFDCIELYPTKYVIPDSK